MSRSFSWFSFLSLWLFAGCMGLMEAAVVVYLRALGDGGAGPVAQLHELVRALEPRLLFVERQRELSTLVMLLIPAYLFSERFTYRLLAYILSFGVWDLAYYLFLRGFLAWPANFFVLDVLFLIPKPWIAPALCPILVAGGMVLFSTTFLFMARTRAAKPPPVAAWIALLAGTGFDLYAFLGNTEAYFRPSEPLPHFPWLWFGTGYALLLVGAAWILVQLYR